MAGYVGSVPVPQSIQEKESFTATAGQTTFNTSGYSSGSFVNVYLNGVRLINGTDYTATNGSDIVLTSAASASDVLDFEVFNEFQLVDQEFASSVTLKNGTHEDTDGGRESTLIFKGEQSGGEISTLAQIQASHDGTSDDQKGDLIFKTNDGSDNNAPTEAMRIDSSQHVLIGKTSTSSASTVDGIMGLNDGRLFSTTSVTTSTEAPFMAARTSTAGDGKFIDFKYNGTSVGDIGSISGVVSRIVLDPRSSLKGAGIAGASIDASNGVINPTDKTGATSDGNINLGSTGARWQNIYLSGGAYIGGTGSSNKLEDYEEGTWTPYLARWSGGGISATYTAQNGRYTKIGRLVTLSFDVSVSAISSQGTSLIYIAGSPFNNPSTQDYDYAGTFGQRSAISSSTVAMSCIKHSTNSAILIRQHDDYRENVDDDWEVGTMRGSITFEVA